MKPFEKINSLLNHLQYNYGDEYAKSLAAEIQTRLNSSVFQISFKFVINKEADFESFKALYRQRVERNLAKGLLEDAEMEPITGFYGEVGEEYTLYLIKEPKE